MLHRKLTGMLYKKQLVIGNFCITCTDSFQDSTILFIEIPQDCYFFNVTWHNFPNSRSSKMFKEASYLNLKVYDLWGILEGKFLDSKATIKKKSHAF